MAARFTLNYLDDERGIVCRLNFLDGSKVKTCLAHHSFSLELEI